MESLNQVIERLASSVVVADSTDLPALAEMHTQFQELSKQIAGQAELAPMHSTAGRAEKLLEQIILREIKDADEALKTIAQSVSELQTWMETGSMPTPAGSTPPAAGDAASSENKSDAAAEDPNAERPINSDDLPLLQEFISESRAHIDTAEAQILRLEEMPDDPEAINAIFRSFHTIKGVAGFLNLRQIGALSHSAENLLDLARKGKVVLGGQAVDLVLEAIDCMKSMILALDQAMQTSGAIPQEAKLAGVLASLHAFLNGGAAPVHAAQAQPASAEPTTTVTAEAQANPLQDASKPAQATAAVANAPAKAAATASDTTVKVATDRLDNLINVVGELVISQAMVAQDMTTLTAGNHRLARNMSQLGKITRELQDLSMSMRMVPIHATFQKMARLVRDLARKALKEIDFTVVGGETELDRNVVEAISDPLVHMVRNAADHGIETPEDRVRAGKPRAGKLSLRAFHQAGNIVIEITDDGKGLNKAKIVKKAVDAGIIQATDNLTDQEIFKLIFHAGLSTADKITDVSGRGVGMDVVRKNVEALRGRIDITSVEGQGSTFTLRLPLTLAVIDGLVVRVGTQRYILPIMSVEQSIQPKAEQLSTVQNRGELCMVRGDLLPLMRLYRLFSVTPNNENPTESIVVIVQDEERRCCLLVDELLGQQQVVIKSLGADIGNVRGISGGAILGDGNVSLILDVPGLIDIASS